MTAYALADAAPTPSFPAGEAVAEAMRAGAVSRDVAELLICPPGHEPPAGHWKAVAVELGLECLGAITGETAGLEGSNVVGFARFRNGDDPPSALVELVVQPATEPEAVAAARAAFEGLGLTVVISADQAGRILDRLIRPKYNAALRLLDEGLATAADMDLTCKLGLGYPDGPIERLERGGLAHHFDVCKALFEVYGSPAYAPARRAVVAANRRDR